MSIIYNRLPFIRFFYFSLQSQNKEGLNHYETSLIIKVTLKSYNRLIHDQNFLILNKA